MKKRCSAILLALVVLAIAAPAQAVPGPRHWAGSGERTVTIYTNLPVGPWTEDLDDALAAWSASPFLNLVDGGRRTFNADCGNARLNFAEVEVCWNTATAATWLGLSSVFGSGDHLNTALTEINASKSWGTNKRLWVLAHELGHDVGLDHPVGCPTVDGTRSVMVANFSCATTTGVYLPTWRDKTDIASMMDHAD